MGFLSSKSAAPPAPVERTPEVKPEVKPDPVEVASAKKSRNDATRGRAKSSSTILGSDSEDTTKN